MIAGQNTLRVQNMIATLRPNKLWTAVEGINPSMIESTNAKFAKWDSLDVEGILTSGSANKQAEVYQMLEDPTIYSYAFFKNNKNEPFKLYPYQDLILNDNHKRVLFCAANQIGKSVALCIKALTYSLMNPGTTTLMVSKTFPQSKDLLRQIKELLRTSELDSTFSIGDTETKTEIYFKHLEEYKEFDSNLGKHFDRVRELKQSRIICVPATEAALGYPVDLMLIDELAFFDDGEYFYKQIAQPRTYTTKGQIIVFSNPNGQQGIFWELWNSPRFHRYRFNFLDCPTNTQEELDETCQELTKEQVDSTLLAEFTSPEGSFLSLEERRCIQEERQNFVPASITEPVYIFFDWAKSRDRTVRGVGVPTKDGRGVFIHELFEYPQGTGYDSIVEDLKKFILERGQSSVAMVGWDNTGVGRGIEDFIKRIREMGVMCNPVEFSLENKSAIYLNFKLLVEKTLKGDGLLSMPKLAECDKQLSKLVFKKSTRGLWMVHHEKESDRDDYPDCIAGLCSLIVQPENAPVTVTDVGGVEESRSKRVHKDVDRCECGNILDPWDEVCSNCQKEVGG